VKRPVLHAPVLHAPVLHAYVAKPGDLIWTDFDPSRGREQAGRRPALVVSDVTFNESTGLIIVCPITSKIRPFPTSVVLPDGLPLSGEILLSHIRSIDALARPVHYAGACVPAGVSALVRAKLAALLVI
jgi:mRNA interferase MazF